MLVAATSKEIRTCRGFVVVGTIMPPVIPSQLINSISSHILENAGIACSHCSQPASSGRALPKCSICHRIPYCTHNNIDHNPNCLHPDRTTGNRVCQTKGWKDHKLLCARLQALNKAEQQDWKLWGTSGRLDRRRLFDIYVRGLCRH